MLATLKFNVTVCTIHCFLVRYLKAAHADGYVQTAYDGHYDNIGFPSSLSLNTYLEINLEKYKVPHFPTVCCAGASSTCPPTSLNGLFKNQKHCFTYLQWWQHLLFISREKTRGGGLGLVENILIPKHLHTINV